MANMAQFTLQPLQRLLRLRGCFDIVERISDQQAAEIDPGGDLRADVVRGAVKRHEDRYGDPEGEQTGWNENEPHPQ